MKCLAVFLLSAGLMFAQSTVFVVRHADRYGAEPDPDITPEGQREAVALAKLLADAKVTHIYTTELVRTQQTAAPTAKEFGVTPAIVSSAQRRNSKGSVQSEPLTAYGYGLPT